MPYALGLDALGRRAAQGIYREYRGLLPRRGPSLAGELDGFMRAAALGLWKNSGAVTESEVAAYNALYSKGARRPRPCSGI